MSCSADKSTCLPDALAPPATAPPAHAGTTTGVQVQLDGLLSMQSGAGVSDEKDLAACA